MQGKDFTDFTQLFLGFLLQFLQTILHLLTSENEYCFSSDSRSVFYDLRSWIIRMFKVFWKVQLPCISLHYKQRLKFMQLIWKIHLMCFPISSSSSSINLCNNVLINSSISWWILLRYFYSTGISYDFLGIDGKSFRTNV